MGQGCLGTSGAVETRGHQAGLHSTVRGEKEKLVSQRHDGQVRDELRLTQPEILRFSMSAQSPSHSPSSEQ
jgi:hypothetical protein